MAHYYAITLFSLAFLASCETSSGGPATDAASGSAADAPDAGIAPPDANACHAARDTTPLAPPDPGPALAPSALDCGTPAFPAGTALRRRPYLQSVFETSARIAWTARSGSAASVRVAPSPDGPWREIVAARELFPVSRTIDENEDFVAFDATVDALEKNHAYCYEVLVDGVPIATHLRFDTAWDDASRPVRILAFGDSGAASAEQLAIRDRFVTRTDDIDLFLHLGDIAYRRGTFAQFHNGFFVPYQDLLHRVPVWPTVGNHEYGTDRAQPYRDVFYLPRQALRDSDQEMYYSFDYANIHFVSLDSNPENLVPIALDLRNAAMDDMIDWLRADLAASTKPWKVAFFHHPPYSSGMRGIDRVVIGTIVAALEEGGVDLALSGHHHHYERMVPLRGSCTASGSDPAAMTFVTNGAGGAELDPVAGDWFTATAEGDRHSFLYLRFHGCGLHGEALDDAGSVIDAFDVNGCEGP